ncbi:MAG: carbohydrate binding family 9 domain-containing protein, partial [bacterium]|nr:carbohydrate binding family 9 domain-containing protein [bacterium]
MRNSSILFMMLFLSATLLSAGTVKSLPGLKIDDKLVAIDGKLDEPIWQKAVPGTNFLQLTPNKGNPASFKTEVRVLYGNRFIYFAITCYDPNPSAIVSRVNKREGEITGDDSIAVALDTFKDGQTAYIFYTNVSGIQTDARLADNGRTLDNTWDGKWLSAGSRTADGWTAEIAIPFETIKYKPGKNQTWGLGVTRFIPRTLEIDTWSGPMEAYTRVSQMGSITALDLKKTKNKRQIIPHLVTKLEKGKDAKAEAGLDVRYAFSQSLSADLTVNPDFATIEADQEEINLTRFELSLKEKRNFFLEGSEIYSQRIRLFYSRRIADIYGGVKVYGKTRGYEFSLMSVQAKKDEETGQGSGNFSVFRFRKTIFRSSNIGFLLANKRINGKSYGNAGIDLVHFFFFFVNLTGQLAFSCGVYNKRNISFFMRLSYACSSFRFYLRYTHLGEHFGDNANSVGFIRDDDR